MTSSLVIHDFSNESWILYLVSVVDGSEFELSWSSVPVSHHQVQPLLLAVSGLPGSR